MKAYEEILGRVQFHINATKEQCSRYYKMGLGLQWGIPILSAILTSFASGKLGGSLETFTFWISGVITIFSVVNSTIRPFDRYTFAVKYSNKFWYFRTSLDLKMSYIESQITNEQDKAKAVHDLLTKKDEELAKIIQEFNDGFMLPPTPTGDSTG